MPEPGRGLLALMLLWIAVAPSAWAHDPEDDDSENISEIKQQIEDGRASAATTTLERMLSDEPKNADLLNLLGYASRKMGRFQASRDFYIRALAIDPDHKGALEYMGELELQTGQFDEAKELLKRLREQCPSGCEELDDLLLAFSSHGIEVPISGN